MDTTLFFFVLLILFFALLPLVAKSRPIEEVLNSKDPTDDEFVRLLGTDISPDVALKVRRLVADVSCWDVDEIWPDTPLGEVFD